MNCIFCQTELSTDYDGAEYCKLCSTDCMHVRYFSTCIIQFIFDSYGLEPDLETNKLYLVKSHFSTISKYLRPGNIVTINYVPYITPGNALYWLNKLSNMKVFL